eukprot:scaffold671_cov286-Chaetoceros_neogracile.AAC.23
MGDRHSQNCGPQMLGEGMDMRRKVVLSCLEEEGGRWKMEGGGPEVFFESWYLLGSRVKKH